MEARARRDRDTVSSGWPTAPVSSCLLHPPAQLGDHRVSRCLPTGLCRTSGAPLRAEGGSEGLLIPPPQREEKSSGQPSRFCPPVAPRRS